MVELTNTSIRADLRALEQRLTDMAMVRAVPSIVAAEMVNLRNRLAFERERLEAVRHHLQRATREKGAARLNQIVEALEIL